MATASSALSGLAGDVPLNNNFLDEHASFPMGRHNDQVDAAPCAVAKLVTPPKTAMIIGEERLRLS
jgi:hypothetical protein